MEDPNKPPNKLANPAEWIDRYGDYLFRYALSRLRDPEASEEVVQETFMAGLQSQGQYKGTGAEQAWLLGILKRKIVDHIRKRNRDRFEDVAAAGDDLAEALFDKKGRWTADPRIFGSHPGTGLERDEFWRVLRSCLEKLPQRQADVFILREMDDKSSEEICKDLEISTSNLWVLLHRARIGLATCMKVRWHNEGGQEP